MYTLLHTLGCTIILVTFFGMLILEFDEARSAKRRDQAERERLIAEALHYRLSRFQVDWS